MKRYIILFITALLLCATQAKSQTKPQEQDSIQQSPVAEEKGSEETFLVLNPIDKLWDQANTAYINGKFHQAAEGYELILERGVGSSKLYYNLANAYFKEQRIGKAILFYKRALRFSPGNEDMRYNLQVAEARTKDNIEAIPEFFLTVWLRDIRHLMGCAAWSVLSLGTLICMLALFLFYLLAQRLILRKVGFYGTIFAALLFAFSTWCAMGERREILDESQAVVMSQAAAVKSSPDKAATDLFVLHEGTTVQITGRLGLWCEVMIDDGKKGWLEFRQIEII